MRSLLIARVLLAYVLHCDCSYKRQALCMDTKHQPYTCILLFEQHIVRLASYS